jgi:transcriptional regulator with XRE-family HTH domain
MATRKKTVPTARRRYLAAELERHREATGLSREDAARRLEWSTSTLWRIETAEVGVKTGSVRDLAALYGLAAADTEALVQLARDARRTGWWKGMEHSLPEGFPAHLEFEATAKTIRRYDAQFVPGLWQTEDYARAIFRGWSVAGTEEQIEQRVEVRMRRQEILTRSDPPPPKLWAILDEAAIRRQVGGREVMREQLQRLRDVTADPKVTLQILPFAAGAHMGAYGAFALMEPIDDAYPTLASTDRPTGSLIEEKPEEIELYTLIFNRLRASALSMTESTGLIAEAMRLL